MAQNIESFMVCIIMSNFLIFKRNGYNWKKAGSCRVSPVLA